MPDDPAEQREQLKELTPELNREIEELNNQQDTPRKEKATVEQLIIELTIIEDPNTPLEERVTLAKIVQRMTSAQKRIQDPSTPPEERELLTKVVERTTFPLKAIQDLDTPPGERKELTTIVKQATGAIEISSHPKTASGERKRLIAIVERLTGTIEVICHPKSDPKRREQLIPILKQVTGTIETVGDPKSDPKRREQLIPILKQVTGTIETVGDPKSDPKRREQLIPILKQVTGTIEAVGDPKTDPKRADSLIDQLKKQIEKLPKPKLVVKKTVVNSRVTPGTGQGFFIEITNSGKGEATGVVLTDDFGPTGIWPVLSAQLETESGEVNECDIAGDIGVKCPKGDGIKIAPGETVKIAINAVVKVREGDVAPLGKKRNAVNVEFDQGSANGSTVFTITEAPKLSESDLQVELNVIIKCARHAPFVKQLGIPASVLERFAEKALDELEQGASWHHALSMGYQTAAVEAGVEVAMSLVKIPFLNVSLLNLAKGVITTADCMEFAKQALSAQ
ncbi:hypothetical protein [Streptomyces virginiae]|uniref:hypothetical protein n=1 Tax=Streptomyces virginiae TaxID=1961 RepID=UPI003866351B|nr:DUF11 domain-containing protein [Streptomyces virginiae]